MICDISCDCDKEFWELYCKSDQNLEKFKNGNKKMSVLSKIFGHIYVVKLLYIGLRRIGPTIAFKGYNEMF